MARPGEEPDVAYRAITSMRGPEPIFLDVGDAFHDEADREQDDACNVSSGTECWLWELGDFWRVENSYGQTTCPYPEHLAASC